VSGHVNMNRSEYRCCPTVDICLGLGKVKCVHDITVIGLKVGGDGAGEMNKSY